MSEEMANPNAEDLGAQADEAARRLQDAAAAAKVAEERATAEIVALEADLEEERRHAVEALAQMRERHEEELRKERETRTAAIAQAEERLTEIESQAESAEKRVEEAERRAEEAESAIADTRAEAREAAAGWLRGQIEAIRREARTQ